MNKHNKAIMNTSMKKEVISASTLFLVIACYFYSCMVPQKRSYIKLCDTAQSYIAKNQFMFKPVILDVDPKFNIYTDKHGEIDCYQFSINSIDLFNKYEVWLDSIRFELTIGTPACHLIGDKVIFYVDQITLGKECLEKDYGQNQNFYDCIYDHDWALKIRGGTCDHIMGPFSSEIKGLSLQCNRPPASR